MRKNRAPRRRSAANFLTAQILCTIVTMLLQFCRCGNLRPRQNEFCYTCWCQLAGLYCQCGNDKNPDHDECQVCAEVRVAHQVH